MSRQRIVVFGAGGRAGRAVVDQAQRRGHQVTGVVRDPGRHADLAEHADPGVRIVAGDLTDEASVRSVVAGADALVNAVTPFTAPPESFDGFDDAYYVRLVENLARTDVARIIEIGLAATLRVGTTRMYQDGAVFPTFLRPFAEARVRGLAAWRGRSADWLVLTPPPELSLDAPATGRYRLAPASLDPVLAANPLSYADLAVAVLDQIESPTAHRDQVAVYADGTRPA
jgi:putative NADH-flavin reductase